MQDEKKRQKVMKELKMQGKQNPELFLLAFNVQLSSVGKYLISYHVLNKTQVILGLQQSEPAYELLNMFLRFEGEDCSEKVRMIDYDFHFLNIPSALASMFSDSEESRTSFALLADDNVYKCYHFPKLRYMEIDIAVYNIPNIQPSISLLSRVQSFQMKMDWIFVLNSNYNDEMYLPEKVLSSYSVETSL